MPHKDPRDPNRWVYTPAEDARERACVNAKHCACGHTMCRDGWMDQTADDNGPVTRCPTCYDAALMADELAAASRPKGRGRW